MNENLDFRALHSDNALLDALGGRSPGAGLGMAAGVTPAAGADPAARLLAAWTEEIDTRPGPLSELLAADVMAAAGSRRHARPLAALPSGVSFLRGRRGRSTMPRAAAAATAGVLVLGLGGVAAAVTGTDPLNGLRRAVGTVAPAVAPEQDPAVRAGALLSGAQRALERGELTLAAQRLAQAQSLLPQVTDARALRTLQARMRAFQERWQGVIAPSADRMPQRGPGAPPGSTPTIVDPDGVGPQRPSVDSERSPAQPNPAVPGTSIEDPAGKLGPGLDDAKTGLQGTKDELQGDAEKKLDRKLPDGKQLKEPRLPDGDELEDPKLPDGEELKDQKLPEQPLPGDLPGPVGGLDGVDRR